MIVAVKLTKDSSSPECIKSILDEIKLQTYLGDHQNLIKFVGAHTKETGYGVIYMVMELCEKGSLQNYLRTMASNKKDFPIDIYEMYRFCEEIASGMDYISKKNVIHSDLATRNVLLNSNYSVKLADFGLSRKLDEFGEYIKTSETQLPWRWMALESLKEKIFTIKSDIWSYGITTWEIFTLGMMPYATEFPTTSPNFLQEIKRGLRLSRPEMASVEIYTAMKTCWEPDPVDRPDFQSLLELFKSHRCNVYSQV